MAQLLRCHLAELGVQLVAVLVVSPRLLRGIPFVVPGARPGGQPDLAVRRLSIENESRTVCKLEGDQAVAGRKIQLVRIELLEPFRHLLQACVGVAEVFLLIHRTNISTKRGDGCRGGPQTHPQCGVLRSSMDGSETRAVSPTPTRWLGPARLDRSLQIG